MASTIPHEQQQQQQQQPQPPVAEAEELESGENDLALCTSSSTKSNNDSSLQLPTMRLEEEEEEGDEDLVSSTTSIGENVEGVRSCSSPAYHRDPTLSPRSTSSVTNGGGGRPQLMKSKSTSSTSRLLLHSIKQQQQQPVTMAMATSTKAFPGINNSDEVVEGVGEKEFPLIYSMCYRGFEMVFAGVRRNRGDDMIRIFHARTRLPAFVCAPSRWNEDDEMGNSYDSKDNHGTIRLPRRGERIVAMTGSSHSGHVILVTHTGLILQIVPQRASPHIYTYGKYVWFIHNVWDASDIFLWTTTSITTATTPEAVTELSSEAAFGQEVHLSLSLDQKLLVACQEQLALFDLTNSSNNSNDHMKQEFSPIPKANSIIAWTTKLSSPIACSDISADGTIIAYALKSTSQASPSKHGVYTLQRDVNDGRGSKDLVIMAAPPSPKIEVTMTKVVDASTISAERALLRRSSSNIGLIYKSHHFLPHDHPISSLKWRGQGDDRMTSSAPPSTPNTAIDSATNIVTNASATEEKNDLLLTSTEEGEFRVYAQSSLKTGSFVYRWIAPPFSIATWVQGISIANLGDLTDRKTGAISLEDITMGSEAAKGAASNVSTKVSSTLYSTTDTTRKSKASTSVVAGYFPTTAVLNNNTAAQSSPASSAGAWICEVTFRDSFPALRLSRLNFGNSSNSSRSATTPSKSSASILSSNNNHLESVAVILPPGTLPNLPPWLNRPSTLKNTIGTTTTARNVNLRSVLSMCVQGIWSAWDVPSDTCNSTNPTTSPPILGGSYAPPSELRLIASHISWGTNVVSVLDIPLWGEADLGINVEFGTPVRHLISVSSPPTASNTNTEDCTYEDLRTYTPLSRSTYASLPLPCSTLVARVSSDGETIHLENRIKGAISVLPLHQATSSFTPHLYSEDENSLDNGYSYSSSSEDIQRYVDVSATPLPVILPSLRTVQRSLLPSSFEHNKSTTDKNTAFITAIHWWPDKYDDYRRLTDNADSMSLLLALTKQGIIIVYEIPSPDLAAEQHPAVNSGTTMNIPNTEGHAKTENNIPAIILQNPSMEGPLSVIGDTNADGVTVETPSPHPSPSAPRVAVSSVRLDYEVMLAPHADFGIGLRLESRSTLYNPYSVEIAIAGSFKKHPLTGSLLPAEKSGRITLGDSLIGVNDIDLSRNTFDDIIETVRNIGSQAAKSGALLKLKFRPLERIQDHFIDVPTSPHSGNKSIQSVGSSKRRTKEDIFGIKQSPSRSLLHSNSNCSEQSRISSHRDDVPPPAVFIGGAAAPGEDFSVDAGVVVDQPALSQQDEYGRIVGLYIENSKQRILHEDVSCSILLPWTYNTTEEGKSNNGEKLSCLLITAKGSSLAVSQLSLLLASCGASTFSTNTEESMSCVILGEFTVGGGRRKDTGICALTEVSSSSKNWCIAATTTLGTHVLVFIDYDPVERIFSFRENSELAEYSDSGHSGSGLKVFLRPFSLDLFATLAVIPFNHKIVEKVTVWSAHPTCELDESINHGEESAAKKITDVSFARIDVNLPFPTFPEERIIDIQWLSPYPTILNSCPQVALWTSERVVVYRQCEKKFNNWNAILELQYCERWRHSALLIASDIPSIIWPHLTFALKSLSYKNDNSSQFASLSASSIHDSAQQQHIIRADWHPDVLLASILLDPTGVSNSLRKKKYSNGKRKFVSGIIHWLSRWIHPDESERPLWGNHVWSAIEWKGKEKHEVNDGVGNVVPITTLIVSSSPIPEDDDAVVLESEKVENAANLMALLQMKPDSSATYTSSSNLEADEKLLHDLIETLKKYIKSHSIFRKKTVSESKKITSLAHRRPYANDKSHDASDVPSLPSLPRPIAILNLRELACLYGLVCLYHSPPNFRGLDKPAQVALLNMELCRHVVSIDEDGLSEARSSKERQGFSAIQDNGASKSATYCSFSVEDEHSKYVTISSSAALSALVSSCQVGLLSSCTSQLSLPGNKMDWMTARSLLIPFWLRDLSELRRLSEEIAMTTFKSTRDVMECALLFVAMRKITTLMNLARTDDSVSGKTFLKFLQNHNFSSETGRKAAEKNAYSLLGKRRYGVAAAFFLLAEPPLLQTALEVIAGSMKDVGLALLVSRLIEDSRVMPKTGSSYYGRGAICSGFGGGGGFASVPYVAKGTVHDEQPFSHWLPNLDTATQRILEGHGLNQALRANDAALAAILYIWLGERNKAIISLVSSTNIVQPSFNLNSLFPQRTNGTSSDEVPPNQESSASFLGTVISFLNAHVNFASKYLTLRVLNAPLKSQWCSILQTAAVYNKHGIELPTIFALKILQSEEEETSSNDKEKDDLSSINSRKRIPVQTTPPTASDFFSRPTPSVPASAEMSSSIFDSFDIPLNKPKVTSTSGTTDLGLLSEKSPSIFNSHDNTPPQKFISYTSTHVPDSKTSGEMTSSIFDMFDVAPQKPKKKGLEPAEVTQAVGDMSSSIFDAFVTAPLSQAVANHGKCRSGVISTSGIDAPDDSLSKGILKPNSGPPLPGYPLAMSEARHPSCVDIHTCPVTINFGPLPDVWRDIKTELLNVAAARRLLREISRVCSLFHGDLPDPALLRFRRSYYPLVPHGAAEVLSHACDVDILTGLQECLRELCLCSGGNTEDVVGKAFKLLENDGLRCDFFPAPSILCSVVLYSIIHREELAEKLIAFESRKQIQLCASFGSANDEFRFRRLSKYFLSSHIMRRSTVQISWQLELCLWLHRGGNVPLSENVLREACIAVRVGLLIGSWGRCHETLENVIRYDPDCALDFYRGRLLWTCWKIINNGDEILKKNSRCGGWEFLVDCTRHEATDMLRSKKAGSFLLRPHPDDHGVFTLSFKTNLSPTKPGEIVAKPVEPDDVIQHAIIRLSDAGFRCGSFGPFGSLMKLLEAVSQSLPFALLFGQPPSEGIIKDKGEQPSPNSILIRKLALHPKGPLPLSRQREENIVDDFLPEDEHISKGKKHSGRENLGSFCESRSDRRRIFGIFAQLLALSEVTKQFCAVLGAKVDNSAYVYGIDTECQESLAGIDDDENIYMMSNLSFIPLLEWRRSLETELAYVLALSLSKTLQLGSVAVAATDTAIEAIPSVSVSGSAVTGGDALIRRMIQYGSGVECRTLRVGEGWHSAMVVLFSRKQAIPWIVASGTEKDPIDAATRLKLMENERVIESLNLLELSALWNNKKTVPPCEESSNIRYRFIDPWEVEPLEGREAELAEIYLGRECYVPFSVSAAARACENVQQEIGGLELLSLWGAVKGGIFLTKAISCILPPWERDSGSDLQTSNGAPSEPTPYISSIRKHLYRNQIFRSLSLPQRFLALLQVELLDLKNLTAPGGTSNILAYSILRLKRPSSSAPLSHKAKTLDCATSSPRKIGKSSGPLAPASWGCVIRFRYPLPEDVNCDGISFDADREVIFKGPPMLLHLVVYEKRFMTDLSLGVADVSLDAVTCSGPLEEWVPLRAGKSGTTWFVRMKITLRFELMCITTKVKNNSNEILSSEDTDSIDADVRKFSVGMKKILELSRGGGLHEDTKSVKRIESSPDFFGYLENMVG